MDRVAYLLQGADATTRILEIGPSHAPVAPRAGGWNSCVLDHAGAEALRDKYAAMGVPTAAIETVDFIWQGGALHEAVPPALHGGFDRLIASHVIEHLPDLLGFLQSAAILLAPGGELALAVPDKRFCFDALRAPSHAGEVLERHARGATRHGLAASWGQHAYSVAARHEPDGPDVIAWSASAVARLSFSNRLCDAWALVRDVSEAATSPYRDTHGWTFTPASFRLLLLELAAIGVSPWQVEDLSDGRDAEFLVRLTRRARPQPPGEVDATRMELLREMLRETQFQAALLLAPPPGPEPTLWEGVLATLQALPGARILELGTRRSEPDRPTILRHLFPNAALYVGLDIEPGPDVDVVGDVHRLSRVVGEESFDAILSLSTFEHLKYPFLAAHEMLKCLRPGGRLFIQTHQSFPLHAYPRDYFRFSADALRALFDWECGFAVTGTAHEFPAQIHSHLGIGGPAYLNACITGIKLAPTPAQFTPLLAEPPQAAPAPMPPAPAPGPASLPALLAEGLQRHRAGDLAAAAAAYRAMLAADPAHPDAWHLLGLAAHAEGRGEEALALVRRAVALRESARYLANLGMILCDLRRLGEAVAACRRALALDPRHVEAWNTLGVALLGVGQAEEAGESHRQALALRPDYLPARLNLGHALAALEQTEAAVAAYRSAAPLLPRLAGAAGRGRVLFVHVGPVQPGVVYRCERMAAAARAAGWAARVARLETLTDADMPGLACLVFWRVQFSPRVCRLLALARAGGARIGLDLDDLVSDPALARAEVIDGIRSMGLPDDEVAGHFAAIARLLAQVDFASCSTAELAAHLGQGNRPAWLLPNGFDAAFQAAAQTAARPADGRLRIGYAGGTRTHQRDIAVAAPALAAVLAAHDHLLLVLFRDPADGAPLVQVDDLSPLRAHLGRIEWRDLVPLSELPAELARFDINIAPLEAGNVFVEAKSELKYFEAALAGVPTLASPTGPFRRAIRDGQTGLLAHDTPGWTTALERLIADAGLRRRLAEAARMDALWWFGPQRAQRLVGTMLNHVAAGLPPPAEPPPGPVPALAETATLTAWDDAGDTPLSVVLVCTESDCADRLAAIAAQDLPALELVLLGPAKELFAQRRRFPRATALSAAPGPPTAALAWAGIARARGDWLLVWPQGAGWPRHALSTLLAAAEPGTALLVGEAATLPPLLLCAAWAWSAAGSQTDAAALRQRLAELGFPESVVPLDADRPA